MTSVETRALISVQCWDLRRIKQVSSPGYSIMMNFMIHTCHLVLTVTIAK
jgi:ABC-type transporter Mla MlaB component